MCKQLQWCNHSGFRKCSMPMQQQLLTELAIVNPNAKGFSLHQGLIRKQNLIWIAQNAALQTKLISAFHSSAIGGHSGIHATYHRLKRHFYWKGMKKDVDSYIQQCSVCQQAKHSLSHPTGLLQPLPIPEGVKGQTQCRRFPHEWGLGKGKTEASLPPRKICGEAASNPRPGDSVRQLSPLHQACPSCFSILDAH